MSGEGAGIGSQHLAADLRGACRAEAGDKPRSQKQIARLG